MNSNSSTYTPAVNKINLISEELMKTAPSKKVLVIGSGCAGLGATWHLFRSGMDVSLFEIDNRIGGHANTIEVDGIEVDTGFMVYNTLNYPNLCAFFEEIGIEGENTTMGFSVSMDNGEFEWCSDSLQGLMSSRTNIINPKFYMMMKDVLKFNQEATKLLKLKEDNSMKNITVGKFLEVHGFSDAFRDYYLIPMTGSIWSATGAGILGFPAFTLFTFLNNHLLLQVNGHLNWKTPAKRSKEYVRKIQDMLGDRIQMNRGVRSILRNRDATNGMHQVLVTDNKGVQASFDEIVFACHPDQILNILGSNATTKEKDVLSKFEYSTNDTYVHCDESLMPKSKSAWTSWNYLGNSQTVNSKNNSNRSKPVFVTYWLNKLQNLNHPRDVFVSLNPTTSPKDSKTFTKLQYSHPQYTLDSVQAQRRVSEMQGENGTYFCGAWMGYGFHEDGFRSGLEVAMAITGNPIPWVKKWGPQSMIPAPRATLLAYQQPVSVVSAFTSIITKPLLWGIEIVCRQQVLAFLEKGFTKGKLTIYLPNGNQLVFNGSQTLEGEHVTLRVFNTWFFVRLALEADLGLARSYIAGEWEIEDTGPYSDGLTKFLKLLIDNMPNGKTKVSGGIDARDLVTAWIGSSLNLLWFRLTMDNTIANSRTNIHAHYDLSNELFQTFLDEKHIMYSCALFETEFIYNSDPDQNGEHHNGQHTIKNGTNGLHKDGQPEPIAAPIGIKFVDSLESAQERKIDALLSRLEPLGPKHHLLDIGFGWGGICIRAAEKYGCKVTGITLSVEQKAFAENKVKARNLEGLITFELVDYRVFAKNCSEKKKKFDRIVSCEMIEAVGDNYLGSFYESIEMLLATEGIFVMQAITMPDARYPAYVKSADLINTMIFPGGCCPSLSALLSAMATNSTLHLENAVNINLHYAETLRRWRKKFNEALPKVLALGFDDAFIRLWNLYLCYCEAGFEQQVINLQILTFSRVANPNMLLSRAKEHGFGTLKH